MWKIVFLWNNQTRKNFWEVAFMFDRIELIHKTHLVSKSSGPRREAEGGGTYYIMHGCGQGARGQ